MTGQSQERGTCPVCGRAFEITRKGLIRHHGDGRSYRCAGAGQPPKGPPHDQP